VNGINGTDLMLKAAFQTELENLEARKQGKYTDQDIIVMNYLKERIKQINNMGVKK
tara:strand:+ start:679 stop:846 length:168 start_codon:yes stop_codon:yes gene_type:complete